MNIVYIYINNKLNNYLMNFNVKVNLFDQLFINFINPFASNGTFGSQKTPLKLKIFLYYLIKRLQGHIYE